jgi:hypothetical protein
MLAAYWEKRNGNAKQVAADIIVKIFHEMVLSLTRCKEYNALERI